MGNFDPSVADAVSLLTDMRIGAPDRIRTCDRWLRRPLLYPAELRALENNIDRRAPHAWRVLPHKWGGRGVSNPLPPEPQSGALPGELRPPLTWEDRTGCRIGLEIGRGREIRTPDILLPKQARYQTALYPDDPEHRCATAVFRRRIILSPYRGVNAVLVILPQFPPRRPSHLPELRGTIRGLSNPPPQEII